MSEVDGQSSAGRQRLVFREFFAVVEGPRTPQAVGQVREALFDLAADASRLTVLGLGGDEVAALAFDQCQHDSTMTPTHHRISFPVAEALALVHHGRSAVDSHLAGDSPTS